MISGKQPITKMTCNMLGEKSTTDNIHFRSNFTTNRMYNILIMKLKFQL